MAAWWSRPAGRNPDDDRVYRAPVAGDLIPGVPIVVLINSATASAAEIVAGALQDDHRATIMGTRSFGKGSVQTIIPVEGHGALRLTTALYYTPSGRSIQDQGITPDIVATLPKSEQVANAVLSHESDLYGALKNAGRAQRQPGRGIGRRFEDRQRDGRAPDQAADHRHGKGCPARRGASATCSGRCAARPAPIPADRPAPVTRQPLSHPALVSAAAAGRSDRITRTSEPELTARKPAA